jgi:hypothetical protein
LCLACLVTCGLGHRIIIRTDGHFSHQKIFSFKEMGPDEYEEMEEEAEEEEEEENDDSADMDESDESDADENESDEGEGEARRRRVFDVPIRRRRCSRLF